MLQQETNNTDNQGDTDNPQAGEREGLTFAEKTSDTYFETDNSRRLFEPQVLAGIIREVIGLNEPIDRSRIPITPSDELARLLVAIRNDKRSNLSPQAELTIDEALHCCFQHSVTYEQALELYLLDFGGGLVGAGSLYEYLNALLMKQSPPPSGGAASEHGGDSADEAADERPFSEVCEALRVPLKDFLDHPDMDERTADEIGDLIVDFFNKRSPAVVPGEHAHHLLPLFARQSE